MGAKVLRRAKLTAALQPVAALFSVPVAVMTLAAPAAGLACGAGVVLAAGSAALVNLWLEKPAQRRAFARRQGLGAVQFAELGVTLGWAAAAALAAAASPWALVPAGLTLLGLGAVKVLAEPDRRRG
jgi:ABC-2 type transport system permease protein